MNADYLKQHLQLKPHPEGGFYRETYRGETAIEVNAEQRSSGTCIYYLLEDTDRSHFHKVGSDELWLYHQGETLELLILEDDGTLTVKLLGNRIDEGEEPQLVVTANTWFGARLKSGSGFTLVSCVVAPGFEFSDYVLGDKQTLNGLFPHLAKEIEEMTL